MRLIGELLLLAIVAAVTGLGLTFLAVDEPPIFDAIGVEPWHASASAGTAAVDAYSLAGFARRGELPLAIGDGFAFRAVSDQGGEPLSGGCAYRVSGPVPPARVWTLSVHDAQGANLANVAGRLAFTHTEVLRDAEGHIDVVTSPEAVPGDWLPTVSGTPFVLMLRLYDTTPGALAGGRTVPELPRIEKVGCV